MCNWMNVIYIFDNILVYTIHRGWKYVKNEYRMGQTIADYLNFDFSDFGEDE